MRVSTQVQISHKEITDAVIEAARKVAGVNEPGSASVKFVCDVRDPDPSESMNLSAVVEFVKAGH